jgi:hypothetical protein
MDRLESWKAIREIIHQNYDLINHRIVAYLTLQGFLFTALVFGGNGIATSSNVREQLLIYIVLILVAIAGLLSGWFICPGIKATRRFIRATELWWEKSADTDFRTAHPFPWPEPVDGGNYPGLDRSEVNKRTMLSIDYLPCWALPLWWALILGAIIGFSVLTQTWQKSLAMPAAAATTTKVTVVDQPGGKMLIEMTFDGDDTRLPELDKRLGPLLKRP